MVNAISKEIRLRNQYLTDKKINTIYLGGGTPSLLSIEELSQILNEIHLHFDIDENVEFTLEANPEDINATSLLEWKKVGVNRLSIGLQVLNDDILSSWNRNHNAEEGLLALDLAISSGFDNITIDLMYGHPAMSNEEWKQTIETILQKGIPHISSYALTVEPSTALAHQIKNGLVQAPEDGHTARHFKTLQEVTASYGVEQYEVSNFAKPGWESRHNSAYWKQVHYLGVGPSAHSFNGVSRQWNVANNSVYISSLEQQLVPFEIEVLTESQRYNELIMTGLRTRKGVSLTDLQLLGEKYLSRFREEADEFIRSGRMKSWNDHVFLSPEQLIFADGIASGLFLLEDL